MRVRSGAADDPKVRFHAMKKKDQKKEGVTLSVELRDFVFERLPSPPTLSRRPRSTTTRTPSTSFSNATLSMETRARKRKRERRDATAANPGEAIPGLLNDIVITHVLRSEYFDATASRIARLTAGSRARSAGASKYSDLRMSVTTMSLGRPVMASPPSRSRSRVSRVLLRARVSMQASENNFDRCPAHVVVLEETRVRF